MIKKIFFLLLCFTCCHAQAFQIDPPPVNDPITKAKNYLNDILTANQHYMTKHGAIYFHDKSTGQTPIATMIACSDSRVQTSLIDETPENDLFVIRNIGNQLPTALGSIEYGIYHLHTPLLLILGHSRCGAITAATSDYSQLEPGIVQELNSLHLQPGLSNIAGVKMNVDNQVAFALKQFKREVDNNELLIVGAIYDFSNDLGQGDGKLSVINIQGHPVDHNQWTKFFHSNHSHHATKDVS